MKKITSILITFVLILSVSASSYGSTLSKQDTMTDINIKTIDEGVYNPAKMTRKEQKAYFKVIEKQVKLMKDKYDQSFDEEWFRKELRFVLETENSFQTLANKSFKGMAVSASSGTWIPDIKVRNDIAAAAFNAAIDLTLIAAGVGSVTLLVKKIGLREARKIFTRTLLTKLKAWGCGVLAASIPGAVAFIFNFLNPGQMIAEFFDSKDSYPNNGYIDIIL